MGDGAKRGMEQLWDSLATNDEHEELVWEQLDTGPAQQSSEWVANQFPPYCPDRLDVAVVSVVLDNASICTGCRKLLEHEDPCACSHGCGAQAVMRRTKDAMESILWAKDWAAMCLRVNIDVLMRYNEVIQHGTIINCVVTGMCCKSNSSSARHQANESGALHGRRCTIERAPYGLTKCAIIGAGTPLQLTRCS